MMRIATFGLAAALAAALACPGALAKPKASSGDAARWKSEAARVTIVRDDWGIAHVNGRTDADAVFGMIYAQAEDDFNRIETNYLTALGRAAEAEGETAIWQDLRQRLFIDPAELKRLYAKSPANLKALMNAWADGLNFYLATHPNVRPKVLNRFEPWMALSFTEGSIGGNIERISLPALREFYGGPDGAPLPPGQRADAHEGEFVEPTGSNGIAIGPSRTADGHALLLINPHTSFYFRSEQHVTSGEGLNAYGAATWGQFFIYQGFNAHIGWMHTSSGVDVVDEFVETVAKAGQNAAQSGEKTGAKPGSGLVYRYGDKERPVTARAISLRYRTADGGLASKSFTVFRTHHGPIVRAEAGKWVSVALMNKPIEALSQSYLRTKAADFESFNAIAERYKANASNNTVFADDKGEIAYLHPQFIPERDNRFDYTKPVDGADPATDWGKLHELATRPHVVSPASGWIQNTNNWPYSAAGPNSPRREAFPRYMDVAGETPRSVHATMLLQAKTDFTLPTLLSAAFDPYLPAFAQLIPALIRDYGALPPQDPMRAELAGEIELLRGWDFRWSADSAATSLAVFWGERMWALAAVPAREAGISVYDYIADRTTAAQKLTALAGASEQLTADFGSWRTPWGEINRFQRLTNDIAPQFSDAAPSIPVPFTSGQWGSLASFGAKRYPGTKHYYGSNGNSFVAVVEFGPKVRAVAVTAGGESGDPKSPHFNDQAQRYAAGDLRPVYFYPEDLKGHANAPRHPGQ